MWLLLTALLLPAQATEVSVEELARLRAEIEELSHDLAMEKEALRGRLRSLEAVRTDLEVQVRAEELSLRALTTELEALSEAAQGDGTADAVLKPAVLAGLDALTPVIRDGLPYRVPERLAAVDELRTQLEAGTLSTARAASRTWQLAEDELRLTRENALDRQTVVIDGREVLADVVRLGTAALYVRTPDGRYGHAARTADGWRFVLVDGRTATQQVAGLFDAVEKQIRVGFFELPNAFPEL